MLHQRKLDGDARTLASSLCGLRSALIAANCRSCRSCAYHSDELGGEQTNPRVSVISIFYNASPYLAEAVESVLEQGFKDFELLLVDDGSKDDGPAIAKAYARRNPDRIRYLQHEDGANHGMSATRNLGLREACGEFVAFIDADDRWRSTKLKEQVAVLERFPDVAAVSGA